jgi:hypothetical protein
VCWTGRKDAVEGCQKNMIFKNYNKMQSSLCKKCKVYFADGTEKNFAMLMGKAVVSQNNLPPLAPQNTAIFNNFPPPTLHHKNIIFKNNNFKTINHNRQQNQIFKNKHQTKSNF